MSKLTAFLCGVAMIVAPVIFAQQKPGKKEVVKPLEKVKEVVKVKPGKIKDLGAENDLDTKSLRRKLTELLKELNALEFGSGYFPKVDTRAKTFGQHSVKIKVDDAGVEVEVVQKKDGKEELKTYKAKSIEDFCRKYPEIAKRHGLKGTKFGFWSTTRPRTMTGFPDLKKSLQQLQRRLNQPGFGKSWQLSPKTFFGPSPKIFYGPNVTPRLNDINQRGKLGIMVEDINDQLARYCQLEPGVGFLVQDVLPDSLAMAAGVKPGDLVIKVNGVMVRGINSIRMALLNSKNGSVSVQVLRKGKSLTLTTKRTSTPEKKVKSL